MQAVLNGNIALFQMALGKGMKAVEDAIKRKLGRSDLKISQLHDISGVESEIEDLNVLHDHSFLAKQVTISVGNGNFVSDEEWVSYLSVGMEQKGKDFLLEPAEIKGMDNDKYLDMIHKTNEIYKRYKEET